MNDARQAHAEPRCAVCGAERRTQQPRNLDTGTGDGRRRLTLAEAQHGDRPTAFTVEEWHALHAASGEQRRDMLAREIRRVVAEGRWNR